MKYNKLNYSNWAAASYLMSAARPQTPPNSRQLSYHTCNTRLQPLAASHYPPSPSNSPKLSSTLVPHVQQTHPTFRRQPQAAYPLKLSRTLVNSRTTRAANASSLSPPTTTHLPPKLSQTLVDSRTTRATHPSSPSPPTTSRFPPKLSRTVVNSLTTPSQPLPLYLDPSPLTTTVPSTASSNKPGFRVQ